MTNKRGKFCSFWAWKVIKIKERKNNALNLDIPMSAEEDFKEGLYYLLLIPACSFTQI